jgi:alternate signal-mediated exported protein
MERKTDMDAMTTNPTVMVVTERKRRRGLMWIAGAIVAALMLGGSTFAYWSAKATFDGGTIIAGDLDLRYPAPTSFWDVSLGRWDQNTSVPGTGYAVWGHQVFLDDYYPSWRMVPGDKLAAAFGTYVVLEGDNLVASLGVMGMPSKTAQSSSWLNFSYEVYLADTLLIPETELPGNGVLMYLSATGWKQDSGQEDATYNPWDPNRGPLPTGDEVANTVYLLSDTSATMQSFTIVIYAAFDALAGSPSATDEDAGTSYTADPTDPTSTRLHAGARQALHEITLMLGEARHMGAQYNGPEPDLP